MDAVSALHPEDVILCTGLVKEAKVARNGFEIIPDSIDGDKRLGDAAPPRPEGRDRRQPRHAARTGGRSTCGGLRSTAIFQVQDALLDGMEAHLRREGFLQVFTPSILGGISEGGAEVFKIDFYGKPAFLRQDPQLHRQLAIAGGLGRVYDLGPSWRAELSHTPRHMSEHRTIAPEISFITGREGHDAR